MISLNALIGLGAFFVFSYLFFTQKTDRYLIPYLVYAITSTFLVKVIHYIEPTTGTNLISSGKNFLLIVLLVSLLFKNNSTRLFLGSKLGIYIFIYIALFALFALLGPGSLIENWGSLAAAPLYMMFYFVGLYYFRSEKKIKTFFTFFVVFYAVNALYASYQSVFGFLGFDEQFLLERQGDVARDHSVDPITGQVYLMVMGFSGFNYSLFYILSMLTIILIAARECFVQQIGKKTYFFLFAYLILLIVTLERTPIIMLGFLPVAFIKNTKKLVVFLILIVGFVWALNHFQDELLRYGSAKMMRFVEIADPLGEQTTLHYRLTSRPTHQIPMMLNNPFGIGVSNEMAHGAHNNYFKIILQTGWIGGLLFLFILFKAVLLCFRNSQKLKGTPYSQLPLGILAASLAMFAAGIPNIPFDYDCALFFWLFLGMVENLPKIFANQYNLKNEKSISD